MCVYVHVIYLQTDCEVTEQIAENNEWNFRQKLNFNCSNAIPRITN